jgi:hypothetical protein
LKGEESGMKNVRRDTEPQTTSTAASLTTPRKRTLGMRRSSSSFSPFSTPVKDSKGRLLTVGEDLTKGCDAVLLTPKQKMLKLEKECGRGSESVTRMFTVDIQGQSSSDFGFLMDTGNGALHLYSEDVCELLHEENVVLHPESLMDKVPFFFGKYKLTVRKQTHLNELRVAGRSVMRQLFPTRAHECFPETTSLVTQSGSTRSLLSTSSTKGSFTDFPAVNCNAESESHQDLNLPSPLSALREEKPITSNKTTLDKELTSTSKVEQAWDIKKSFSSFTPTQKRDAELKYFRVNFNTKLSKKKHKTYEHDGQMEVNFSDHQFVCIPDATESRLGTIRGKYNCARSNFQTDNTVMLMGMEFYIVEEMLKEEFNREQGIE